MHTIGETDRLIADFAAMSDEKLAAFEAQRAQELAPREVLVEARRTIAERFEPYGYRHIKSQHLLRKRVRDLSFRIYFYSSQHNQKGLFAFLSPTVGVGSQRLKSWRVKQRWSSKDDDAIAVACCTTLSKKRICEILTKSPSL